MDPDSNFNLFFLLDFLSSIYKFNTQEVVLWIVLFLLLAFFFILTFIVSGAEVAYFSLTYKDHKVLKKMKRKVAHTILKTLEKPSNLLATILITNAFCALTTILILNWLLESIFINYNQGIGFRIVKIVFEIFFLIFFAELIPKLLANQNNIKFAIRVAPIIHVLNKISLPFSKPLTKTANFLEKKFAKKKENIHLSDIHHAIEVTTDHTQSSEHEVKMLKGVIQFVNSAVKEIMQNRMDIAYLKDSINFETVMKKIKKYEFSRLPVIHDSIDSIIGILYLKDILGVRKKSGNYDWKKHLREPLYIHEDTTLNDVLKKFQTEQKHIAIVIDEYGGTSGLVTLEDILEEIVGEIHDESDNIEKVGERIDDFTYIFEGKTNLNDISKIMKIPDEYFDPFKDTATTLAGMALEIAGRFPKKKETFHFEYFDLHIVSMKKNIIEKIKFHYKAPLQNE